MMIHSVNNSVDYLVRINYTSFELFVIDAMLLTRRIDADYVSDHQFEITAIY